MHFDLADPTGRCPVIVLIGPAQECIGLGVINEGFLLWVEIQRAAQSNGKISQMTEGCCEMGDFRVSIRSSIRANCV